MGSRTPSTHSVPRSFSARLSPRSQSYSLSSVGGPSVRSRASLRINASGQPLSLHIAETTISFPFDRAEAQSVSAAIKDLLQTFAAKQAAERPKRWQSMEYSCKGAGEGESQVAFLELFCNPNAYSSAFDAKVLISLKTEGGVAVTTEGRLSAVKGDIDSFLGQES